MKSMTEDEKWEYLVSLDETLLKGGVILSEWATFLIEDADMAFVAGAHLASIITSLAGVETHVLRKYRNKWVHVADPWDDDALLKSPEEHEAELEEMARRCAVALRRTIYTNPWI